MALEFAAPSGPLQQELEEVAVKARVLSEHIRSANFLPQNFPRSQLEGICRNLVGLPHGSAEGCCIPLTYARKRLPAIRREYVSARPDGAAEDKETPPAVMRGDNLDALLKDLLASVTTALDQYQVEAGADVADSVDRETGVEGAVIVGIDTAVTQAHALEQRMGTASETVRQINQKGAYSIDKLARQYKDVEIQSGLAKAELSMPLIRVSWYQPVVTQLRRMPEIIEKTGKAIRVATDVARPLVQRWNDFKANIWSHALHEIEETGKTLEQVGRRLRAARDSNDSASNTEANDIPVDFDSTKARDMIASGIAPPQSWIPWIDQLDFGDANVGDPEILESLASLRTLRMNRVYASALPSIGRIRSLRDLRLYGYWLTDINSLASLNDLTVLVLERTAIQDLSSLQSLPKLRVLKIGDTPIKNLGPLRQLTNLEHLSVNKTAISDLSPLIACAKLIELDVSDTNIKDLAPISNAVNLRALGAARTGIEEIAPIAQLRSIQELSLEGTRITSIEALRSHSSLTHLCLSGTRLNSIEAIRNLKFLEVLELERTQVVDLSALEGLDKLRQLGVAQTPVQSVHAIANLESLRELTLNRTKVRDLSPLRGLKQLQDLRINATSVADLTPLKDLVQLRMLQLDHTAVVDLSPLAHLENLEEIWLDHTSVKDLGPLSKLQKLRTIWINGTRVKDVSCLASCAALESVIVGTEARRAKLQQTLVGRVGVLKVVR